MMALTPLSEQKTFPAQASGDGAAGRSMVDELTVETVPEDSSSPCLSGPANLRRASADTRPSKSCKIGEKNGRSELRRARLASGESISGTANFPVSSSKTAKKPRTPRKRKEPKTKARPKSCETLERGEHTKLCDVPMPRDKSTSVVAFSARGSSSKTAKKVLTPGKENRAEAGARPKSRKTPRKNAPPEPCGDPIPSGEGASAAASIPERSSTNATKKSRTPGKRKGANAKTQPESCKMLEGKDQPDLSVVLTRYDEGFSTVSRSGKPRTNVSKKPRSPKKQEELSVEAQPESCRSLEKDALSLQHEHDVREDEDAFSTPFNSLLDGPGTCGEGGSSSTPSRARSKVRYVVGRKGEWLFVFKLYPAGVFGVF